MVWLAGAALLAWALGGSAVLMWLYRGPLSACWREPVLRRPVLIIESDDWGPGPEAQAPRLQALAQMLGRHRDRDGRPAVMTLGLTLAIPDTVRIQADGLRQYYRLTLADARFTAITEALRQGEAAGVFALQLHGMEHYWPPALMAAAVQDAGVRQWLSAVLPATEALPSALQSRWVDGSRLPSVPIPAADVQAAVREEVSTFRAIFGRVPVVVVPPTFVWSPPVERAWVEAGVEIVITPGRRYESRNSGGQPQAVDGVLHNAQLSPSGVYYMVRDDYFEPALAHRAEQALQALVVKTRLGRPVLLETHRFNFMADEDAAARAMDELDTLLTQARTSFPDLRFMSTEVLARILVSRDPAWVEHRLGCRVGIWLRRVRRLRRFWRLWRLTGVGLLAGMLLRPEGAAASSSMTNQGGMG